MHCLVLFLVMVGDSNVEKFYIDAYLSALYVNIWINIIVLIFLKYQIDNIKVSACYFWQPSNFRYERDHKKVYVQPLAPPPLPPWGCFNAVWVRGERRVGQGYSDTPLSLQTIFKTTELIYEHVFTMIDSI